MNDELPQQDADMIQRAEEILSDIYERQEDFNEELDQADAYEIPGRAEPIKMSEVLFWVDRTAYYDELKNWSDRTLENTHDDATKILVDNDQEGLFRELVDAIKRNRVAPFIGAGMSCASGFPSWEESLKGILSTVEEPIERPVTAALNQGNFLEAAEALWGIDEPQVVNFIRSKFAESRIRPNRISGAIHLLEKLSSGCIVTTNFDRVIEAVIARLDGYMHGRQPGHNFVANLMRGKRCLLKLHGDTDSRDSYVFTREQYAEAYGDPLDFKRPLTKALRQIYISHSLLFLGCGMEKDRTLELFEHVNSLGEFEIPDHFAILPEPTATSAENHQQKESRLLQINVRPIWYPEGQHDYVEKLLKLGIDCAGGRFSL
jgi:hypothetical protein